MHANKAVVCQDIEMPKDPPTWSSSKPVAVSFRWWISVFDAGQRRFPASCWPSMLCRSREQPSVGQSSWQSKHSVLRQMSRNAISRQDPRGDIEMIWDRDDPPASTWLVRSCNSFFVQRGHRACLQDPRNDASDAVTNDKPVRSGTAGYLLLLDCEKATVAFSTTAGDEASILAHQVRVSPLIGRQRGWKGQVLMFHANV